MQPVWRRRFVDITSLFLPKMSLFTRKCLFDGVKPFVQPRRFRGKYNVQKPKPPHFERAKFLELVKPRYPNPNRSKTLAELCKKDVNIFAKNEVENPYQRILANELYERLKQSRLIAFYHLSPMDSDTHFKAYAMFKKEDMYFKQYGKKTMKMAVEGTPYEAIMSLFVSRNITVTSPKADVKTLLKITKKFPQIILLAGVLEGKFVSKDELVHYSMIPSLEAAQAGLVQTLNSVAGNVVTQLNSHQNTLISQLSERMKQLDVEKK